MVHKGKKGTRTTERRIQPRTKNPPQKKKNECKGRAGGWLPDAKQHDDARFHSVGSKSKVTTERAGLDTLDEHPLLEEQSSHTSVSQFSPTQPPSESKTTHPRVIDADTLAIIPTAHGHQTKRLFEAVRLLRRPTRTPAIHRGVSHKTSTTSTATHSHTPNQHNNQHTHRQHEALCIV